MSYLTDLSCSYKLDGNANAIVGINNGIELGNTYGAGKIKQAAYFNGSSSIQIPSSSDFTFLDQDFSFSVWAKFNSVGRYIIVGQIGPGGANNSGSVVLQRLADNTVLGVVLVGTTGVVVISSQTIANNIWHHIGFVRDAGTLRLYVNGSPDGTADVSTNVLNDVVYPMSIGAAGVYPDLLLDGAVDDLNIWKRALSAAEITSIFTKRLTYPFTSSSSSNFFPFFK